MYWSTHDVLLTPYWSKVMSRNRFDLISKFLHFVDNEARDPDCTDRLFKVRPILDHVISR